MTAEPPDVPEPAYPLHALATFELTRYRRELERAVAALPVPAASRKLLQDKLTEVLAEQHSRTAIAARRPRKNQGYRTGLVPAYPARESALPAANAIRRRRRAHRTRTPVTESNCDGALTIKGQPSPRGEPGRTIVTSRVPASTRGSRGPWYCGEG
jgi:hypothetical protein